MHSRMPWPTTVGEMRTDGQWRNVDFSFGHMPQRYEFNHTADEIWTCNDLARFWSFAGMRLSLIR